MHSRAGASCRLILMGLAALAAGATTWSQTAARDDAVVLGAVDDTAEGCRSLGASGHAVAFTRPAEVSFIEGLSICCARYGAAQAPERDFHVYVLDQDLKVLADLPFVYGEVPRGGPEDLRWCNLETPAIEVPEVFTVALSFEPDQTSGIYVGFDESVDETHSSTGLPEDGFQPVDQRWDWMVRLTMVPTPSDGVEVRRLADAAGPAATAETPATTELLWDDDESDGQQSYGGAGPRIVFDLNKQLPEELQGKDLAVYGLRIFGSRYGGGYDPQETMIECSFLDADGQVYGTASIPYARFGHEAQWVEALFDEPVLIAPAANGALDILLDPQAHQTKGIYWHYNSNPAESHSSVGSLDRGFRGSPDREWMIRALVGPAPAAP